MPPCSCTVSAATWAQASPHQALATCASPAASSAPPDTAYDAAHEAERHSSTSTSMSAIRCLSAWNEASGRPNCTRCRVWATVISRARAASPVWSAATPTAPTSSARSQAVVASSAMRVAGVASKASVASRIVWSIVGVQVRPTPAGSTSNSAVPAASRAATTRSVARSPSRTWVAVPVSRSPSAATEPAAGAIVAVSPAAIRGSSRRRVASSAPASSASAVTSVASSGLGAIERPSSSRTRSASKSENPAPS